MSSTTGAGEGQLQVDDQGRLAMDVECVACGYNLRTVLAEGRCPECGLAVGRSTVGHWLRYRDPMWLQCLWRGLNRLSITIVAMCVIVLFAFLEGVGVLKIASSSYVLYALWMVVAPAFAVGFGLLGLIRSTRPDPAKLAEPLLSWRRLTRLALVGVLQSTAGMIVTLAVMDRSGIFEESPAFQAAMFMVLICMILIPLCLLMHARMLAMHVPRVGLARTSLGVALVWTLAGSVLSVILSDPPGVLDWIASQYYIRYKKWPIPPSNAIWAWRPGDAWQSLSGFREDILVVAKVLAFILTGCLLACVGLFVRYWVVMKGEADFALRGWAAEVDRRAAVGDAAVDGA